MTYDMLRSSINYYLKINPKVKKIFDITFATRLTSIQQLKAYNRKVNMK